MPTHGPFSPDMVQVYLAAIAAGGVLFKVIEGIIDKRRQRLEMELRRKWELEDRAYKIEQKKMAMEAQKAAAAAARIASTSSKEISGKIEASREERRAQIQEVKASVDANTALTQEAKVASQDALVAANNHNAKIYQATEIANEALRAAAEAKSPAGQA